jgi:hypothetical protein
MSPLTVATVFSAMSIETVLEKNQHKFETSSCGREILDPGAERLVNLFAE